MPKSRRPRQTASQQKFKNEVKNLKARIKRAEKSGFIFSEDIVPSTKNLPRRVPKASIEAVKKIKGEELYKRATSFVAQEKAIPISQGIEILKQRRKETSIRNLPNRKKVNDDDEIYQRGKILLLTYNDLSESGKVRFIRDLSNEDFEAFQYAKDILGEDYSRGRREADSGRETAQTLLQDEGIESEETAEAEDYYEDDFESEGTEAIETEDAERKAYDETKDEKLKEWREHYKREKKKRKKDREFIYDGDSIYTGILARLEQFESDYSSDPEKFNRANNKKYEVSFKRMLENEIRTEGFSTVMRRLDKKGPEIDTALETLLYEPSDEEKVSLALVQLSAIIKGRSLTMQESLEITEISEAFSHDGEDDDLDDKPIDQLI